MAPAYSGGFLACEEEEEEKEAEEDPSVAWAWTLGFLAAEDEEEEKEEAPKLLLGSGAELELRFWPRLPSCLGGSEGPAASGSGSTSRELTERGFLWRWMRREERRKGEGKRRRGTHRQSERGGGTEDEEREIQTDKKRSRKKEGQIQRENKVRELEKGQRERG